MKQWALILGASSGIGAACAKKLAKSGLNIYGIYLRKKQNEIGKYMVKNGIKHFTKDLYQNFKVTYENDDQEIFK